MSRKTKKLIRKYYLIDPEEPTPAPAPLSNKGGPGPLPPAVSPQFNIIATKTMTKGDAVRLLYKVNAAINYDELKEKTTEKRIFGKDYWKEAPKAENAFEVNDIMETAMLKRLPENEFIFDKSKWVALRARSETRACFCESELKFIVVDHEENCKLSLLESN